MLQHKTHLSYWGAMKTFDAWWGKKTKQNKTKKTTQNSNRERCDTRCQTLCLWARAAWWAPVMQTHTRMYAHTDTCTQKFTTQHRHTESSEREEANDDLQRIPTKSHSGRMPVVLSPSGRSIAGAKKKKKNHADFCVIVPLCTSSGATERYQVNENVDFLLTSC